MPCSKLESEVNANALSVEAEMRKLDSSVVTLLNSARKLGSGCIVTNADNGWVEQCARERLPSSANLLSQARISIVSARSRYESVIPHAPMQWKLCAFRDLMLERQTATNVISVGDSNAERTAVHAAKQYLPCKLAVSKAVVFKAAPSIRKLRHQICECGALLERLVEHKKDLDVRVSELSRTLVQHSPRSSSRASSQELKKRQLLFGTVPPQAKQRSVWQRLLACWPRNDD